MDTVKDLVKTFVGDMKAELIRLVNSENNSIRKEVQQLREENTKLRLVIESLNNETKSGNKNYIKVTRDRNWLSFSDC